MSNVIAFIDVVKPIILAIPSVQNCGFTEETIYKRFPSQIKADQVQYPNMTLSYDRNGRAIWANVDAVRFYITIQVKNRDDIDQLVDDVIDVLQNFKIVNGCLTVYKCFYIDGPQVPLYDRTTNSWETTLEFDVAVG